MEVEAPKKVSLTDLLNNESQMMLSVLESEGEILPDLERAFLDTEVAIARKIDSYSYVMKRLEAEAEFRKKEAQNHKDIQKRCESAIERMRDSLKETMHFHQKKELLGHKVKFSLSPAARPTIELMGDCIPDRFARIKTEISVDKDKVLEAFKSGEDVSEFSIIFNDRLLEKANTESKKELK